VSAEPNIAALVAQISALQGELAAKDQLVAQVQADVAAAEAKTASALAARDAAVRERDAVSESLRAANQASATALKAEQAKTASAVASRDALAAKFDSLHGPVEPGISSGPAQYIVDADRSLHPTLRAARIHRIALGLAMPDSEAQKVYDHAKKLPELLPA
jgi:chromosome segregation ATPase